MARGRRSRRAGAPGLGSAARRPCRRAPRRIPAPPAPGVAARPRSAIAKVCHDFRQANAKIATRQASGTVLDTLTRVVPELVGGSADLTPSNNTKAKDQKDVRRGDYAGRYIRYGVREHGMAAAMNGIAVHGGLIPYGGTFLTFSDYARPSIRLAAFMGVRRHLCDDPRLDRARRGRPDPSAGRASGGVARDAGALRLPPGRPGRDRRVLGPGAASARCPLLARSDPPIAAAAAARAGCGEPLGARRLCAGRGRGQRQVTLLATGSEVSVAMAAREALARRDRRRRRLDALLGALREGATGISGRGARLGAAGRGRGGRANSAGTAGSARAAPLSAWTGFGASAPGEALFPHFGITPERVAEAARSLL